MIKSFEYESFQDAFMRHCNYKLEEGYYIRYIDNDCIWKVGVELVNDEANIHFPFLLGDYCSKYTDLVTFGGVLQRMFHDINERIAKINDNNHIILEANFLINSCIPVYELYDMFDTESGYYDLDNGYCLEFYSVSDNTADKGFVLYNDEKDYERVFLFRDFNIYPSWLIQCGGGFDRMAMEINRAIYELELKGEFD